MTLKHKEVKNNYYCFEVGYCDLNDLLKLSNNIVDLGSTSGIYGWNYSVYLLPNSNIAICTGYRNMPNDFEDNELRSKIVKKYKLASEKINKKFSGENYNYDKMQKAFEKLAIKFTNEIQKNIK